MRQFLIIIFLLLPFVINAQIISTYAGTGSNVFSGNGVPATTAGIPDPAGGTFDKYGNYYFADALSSNRIRKIDLSGIITTVAGGGTGGFADGVLATATVLNLPWAVRLDTFGNLIIVDGGNNRIRKVDASTGIISTIAGTGAGTFGGDNGPATSAKLWDPQDICVDKKGNLYIVDGYNVRIRKVNTFGIITTIAGNGTSGYNGDGILATTAELSLPSGIAIDDTGNVYIADVSGNRVRKVDTFGIITTVAGNGTPSYIGDNISATSAQINPIKVAFDTGGHLFIADHFNYRVFKIDGGGIIHSIAGNGVDGFFEDGGPATAAEFSYPSGVSFDPCGNLYIPEPNNRRIRKVTFNLTCDPTLTNAEVGNGSAFSIYPNPTYEELHIDNVNTQATYTIQSIVGTVIQQGILHTGSNTIPVATLPPRMYLLQLSSSGEKIVRKIIKQ